VFGCITAGRGTDDICIIDSGGHKVTSIIADGELYENQVV
jgi:hypothetical protein